MIGEIVNPSDTIAAFGQCKVENLRLNNELSVARTANKARVILPALTLFLVGAVLGALIAYEVLENRKSRRAQ